MPIKGTRKHATPRSSRETRRLFPSCSVLGDRPAFSWSGARPWPALGADFHNSDNADRHTNNLTVSLSNNSDDFVYSMWVVNTIPTTLGVPEEFPFDPGVAARHVRLSDANTQTNWLSLSEVSACGRDPTIIEKNALVGARPPLVLWAPSLNQTRGKAVRRGPRVSLANLMTSCGL